MKNEINNFGKRTANQINSILFANNINAKSENLGDGRSFLIHIESNIKNRYKLKNAGFILLRGHEFDKSIGIKAF